MILSTLDHVNRNTDVREEERQQIETHVTYSLEECIDYIGLGRYQWRLISILGFCSMADAVEMILLAISGPALACYWPDDTQIQIATLTTVCLEKNLIDRNNIGYFRVYFLE